MTAPIKNDPLGNFDSFFYELERNYSYKDRTFENGLSLSDIRGALRPALARDPSWENLARALQQAMQVHIIDPHLYSVISPVDLIAESDWDILRKIRLAAQVDLNAPDPSQRTLKNASQFRYLSALNSPLMAYGIIETPGGGKIGYIYVNALVQTLGGSGRLDNNQGKVFAESTDRFLEALNSRGATKLIVDIRSNAGGAVHNARRIASRFVSESRKFMISEERKASETLRNGDRIY